MIDAVIGWHMNPATCGVAKFNHALAKRLGVPYIHVENNRIDIKHPLVSIKPSECGSGNFSREAQWWQDGYTLFLHGSADSYWSDFIVRAKSVIVADQQIAKDLHWRAGVKVAHCPSTVEGNPTRGKYRVLAFGMAHKLVLRHFEHLKEELDRDNPDYTIELSTAVHEGNPWDQALTESTEAMRGIFGERLRVLGFLADDALARVLQEVDAVAAFYVPALRANNTTAWAALSAGKFLYTNLDEHSPELNPEKYSWDALLKVLA